MSGGATKSAPATVTSMAAVAGEAPTLNRMRNTRAFLRTLSLKAEKNWHQNSGAKRLDVISDRNMTAYPVGDRGGRRGAAPVGRRRTSS